MPSKPGVELAGKELIASRTFCLLTIKEKSPGSKASGTKSSRDGEERFFYSSAPSSLNEANESSKDNNLITPLISKTTTFASTFLASDKCVRFLATDKKRFFTSILKG
jgi:hypothetical protein